MTDESVVVAWVMFPDGTGAAHVAQGDEESVQAAVDRMAEEKGAPASISGSMSPRSYEGLRREAQRKGIKDAPSVGDLLWPPEET